MAKLRFNTTPLTDHGSAIELAPGVRRVTCNNPGPFTFCGTNSYIIGEGDVMLLDPGPVDSVHIDALLAATKGERIDKILISHTHADHSAGAKLLQDRCGAPIYAEGPHRDSRPLHLGEVNALDASSDRDLVIDHQIKDGDQINGDGWALTVLHTPGHAMNHLCFAFTDGTGLFSADHVMAWSTSIVAPPDGSMADYMSSLDRLIARNDPVFWPGHGDVLEDPKPFLAGLKAHRVQREAALVDRLTAGDETIAEMVAVVYRDVDRSLHDAASLSMFAQLEYLMAQERVVCLDEAPTLSARYRLVD
ncbi:Glyoxylase, beta-lactamase superfamily II [Cohaesibacter sp. ES.047]|uniref:MBL fold metallo-hydrolase n=1 Tax=Cohaesibacter sp. ES.047 TaxID=1798205 RepID=UPI000BB81DFB|nr:MBL fold metallo-hydrolase [Cohaesibacter sp. ES.047]SNY92599.1 Glyoxylase, beta-lactamase superfamily II [Cohaesibacter sp. ES.047]